MTHPDLLAALRNYNTVFWRDTDLIHGAWMKMEIKDVPRSDTYTYIEPNAQDENTLTTLNLLVHGCMDKRVVRFTYDNLNINGVSRVMTTTAGGAEQWENSTRFEALVGYLSAVRNASITTPELLLLVHAGGSDDVGECGGFGYLAGRDVVQGFRAAGNIEDEIVWRAKQTRDAVWKRSRSARGEINVGCVMVGSNDQALYIDRF